MASLRPGALQPDVWAAALRKHLAADTTAPDAEAVTTWVALWHAVHAASPELQAGVPSLEVFVTRRAPLSPHAERRHAALATTQTLWHSWLQVATCTCLWAHWAIIHMVLLRHPRRSLCPSSATFHDQYQRASAASSAVVHHQETVSPTAGWRTRGRTRSNWTWSLSCGRARWTRRPGTRRSGRCCPASRSCGT